MKYLLAYILPLTCVVGLTWSGPWSFLTPVFAFMIIPALEILMSGKDTRPFDVSGTLEWFYHAMVYLHVPLVYVILFFYFTGIDAGRFETIELIGLTLSVGIILGAMGMNLGHELGHRTGSFNQLCANLFWLPNLYMHFGIEHNLWHHKYVATEEDPASAPEGMSLYRFWVTSVFGNIKTAWKVERTRLDRQETGPKFNRMLAILCIELAYLGVVLIFFGSMAALMAIVVAVVGFLLLETVNYIEHYGLRRAKLPNGRFEAQGPQHSWNSNHEIGRIFLYELVRHPDHHLNANKPYQTLEAVQGSPQLPFGYPTCVLLAFFPWIWKKRMGRELDNFLQRC